jgi:DNA-binding CsgD family transcriptional regulator
MGEPGNTEPSPDTISKSRFGSGSGLGVRDTSASQGHRELSEALGRLELALLLIELDDFTVTAASEAALRLVGMTPTAVVRHPVVDLIGDEDRMSALLALGAMRAGVIDFYRAHRRFGPTEASGTVATAWVRAVEFDERRVALTELVDGMGARPSPLVEFFGRDPLQMAIGGVDSAWVVTSVSDNINLLLGVSAGQFVGRSLLGAAEQGDVLDLLHGVRPGEAASSIALPIRLQDGTGAPKTFCCVLTSLAGSTDRLFILIDFGDLPVVGATDRAAQLERHLWRIAAEVEASGILQRIGNVPNATRFPQAEALSDRQWEVLRRLMRGERVPTIAAALFVNQSTVRNHLSAIFKRFGVHSQAELLALLERTDESPN